MKTLRKILCAGLVLAMLASLTLPAFADYDDGIVECDYCGEVLYDWGLCPNCSGCSEEANYDCWSQHHCNDCGACLVSDDDPSAFCPECHLCCDCWDEYEHCAACYKHSDSICQECGLCEDCGWEVTDTCCFDCGAHTCDNYCINLEDNMINHCADCCVICNMCGECWHSRGAAEICEYCGCCPECTDDPMLHCPECGACYEEAGMCENGEPHCKNCCEDAGLVCDKCGEVFCGNEAEYCDECGMCVACAVDEGLHCSECEEAHVECEECGLCLDCAEAQEKHCPECGRCYEIFPLCKDGGEHCCECCEENEWLCPQCEECTEGTGNELCQFCGLCSQCCLANSEAAGYKDGTCVYDQSGSHPEELYVCEQCKEKKYPSEMCDLCWLCKDCCLKNSKDAGCDCGMCVNDFGFKDHDCSKVIRTVDIYGVPLPVADGLKTVEGIGVRGEDEILYVIESVKWVAKSEDGTKYVNQSGAKFRKGFAYAIRLVLRSGGGCVFSDDLMISLNGEDAAEYEVTLSKADNMATVTVFVGAIASDKAVSVVRLYPNIDDPKAGQAIDVFCDVQGNGKNEFKNAGSSVWMTSDARFPKSEKEMASWSTGNFFGGKNWFISVTLKPSDGYSLSDPAVYLNDREVPDSDILISYNENNGTYRLSVFVKYLPGSADVAQASVTGVGQAAVGTKISTIVQNISVSDGTKAEINRSDVFAYTPDGTGSFAYADEAIESGRGYRLSITLKTKPGFFFDPDLSVSVNGTALSKENVRLSSDRRYAYADLDLGFFGAETVIPTVDILNLPAKIFDAEALPALKPAFAQEHVSLLGAEWQRSENGSNWYKCGRYEICDPDAYYRIQLRVKADYGYKIQSQNSFRSENEQQNVFGAADGSTYLVMVSVSNDAKIRDIGKLCFTGVPEPKYGKSVVAEGLIASSGIQCSEKFLNGSKAYTSFSWSYSYDGKTWRSFTGTYFEAGYYYRIEFSGELKWTEYRWNNPGYSTDPSYSQAYVNGVRADLVETEEADGTVYIYVTKNWGRVERDRDALNLVNLTLEPPVKDMEIAKAVPASSAKNAALTSYSWTEGGKPASGSFAAGKEYLLSVELEAADGRFFTPMTKVLVNGKLMSSVQTEDRITAALYFTPANSYAKNDALGNLVSAKMLQPPAKTKYKAGEQISLAGLRIRADYENGSALFADGEGVTASPATAQTEGKQTVTLSFESFKFSYEITVEKPGTEITGIELTKLPAKTSYLVGDKLETAGMEVTVHTTAGDSVLKDGKNVLTTPGIFTEKGEQTVSVVYVGHQCSFSVSVSEPTETVYKSMEIFRLPFRQKYFEGDIPDLSGLIVKIETNKEPLYFYDGKGVTVSGNGPLPLGLCSIKLEYGTLSCEFDVEAIANDGKHAHLFSELVEEVPATCQKTGMKAHYGCTGCGKFFDTGKNEVPVTELILPLIPHNDGGEWKYSSECHWKSCAVCGALTTSKYAHRFNGNDGSCAVCSYVKGAPVPGENTDVPGGPAGQSGLPGWLIPVIIIAVIMLAVIIAVAVICVGKKKKSEEKKAKNSQK